MVVQLQWGKCKSDSGYDRGYHIENCRQLLHQDLAWVQYRTHNAPAIFQPKESSRVDIL